MLLKKFFVVRVFNFNFNEKENLLVRNIIYYKLAMKMMSGFCNWNVANMNIVIRRNEKDSITKIILKPTLKIKIKHR